MVAVVALMAVAVGGVGVVKARLVGIMGAAAKENAAGRSGTC